MLSIVPEPMSDPEKAKLREWIQHEGFGLYRKYLRSQSAERQAKASNTALGSDQPNDQPDIDSRFLTTEARVLIAAEKMLEQIQSKDYNFYTVAIKPQIQPLATP